MPWSLTCSPGSCLAVVAPGARCVFLAGSPIAMKFQHRARLGSSGGQGHWWDEEPATCLPAVSAGCGCAWWVSSPDAELPESLAALCRPELSPRIL